MDKSILVEQLLPAPVSRYHAELSNDLELNTQYVKGGRNKQHITADIVRAINATTSAAMVNDG